jgi:hypothetical protein
MNVRKSLPVVAAFVLGAVLTSAVAFADKQPLMKNALKNLQEAKVALNNATGDKGGHRMKAIELIDSAIGEVEKGIAFDNENDSGKRENKRN